MTFGMFQGIAVLRKLALLGGLAVAAMGVSVASTPVFSQSYPVRPIRIIVAVPPGGPTDLLARQIGRKISESWGQAIIVENLPGAGQLIGTAAAAKAAPDGYTLLMTTNVFPVNTWMFKSLPYDPRKDFTPITLVASSSLVLVVDPSLKIASLKALIEYAKANPGKLNYGSSGVSSSLRFAVELLKSMAGVDLTHVPYSGAAPMITALLGGVVQVAFVDQAISRVHIASGRLRALAVTGTQRSTGMPDVPTMSEAGMPGYLAGSWFGLLAPAGTPGPVIAKVQAEVARVLKNPDVQRRLYGDDEVGIGSTPAEFAAFIDAESAKWGKIIRDNNISAQ